MATFKASQPSYAYELDRGWSFDGNFIPHFLELNWFWGATPTDNVTVQKVRVHGLTKGFANLSVAVNGMEADDMDYLQWYTEPQFIDLPKAPYYVTSEYTPVTNYTDVSGRGLSVQLKFEGRNTDIALPEPVHVLQVMVLQTTGADTGLRSN